MKPTKLIGAIVIIFSLLSFKNKQVITAEQIAGNYGVCNSPNSPYLQLNANYTYHYTDKSNSKKVVDVDGKWLLKGNVIFLIYNYKKNAFHNKWRVDGKCIKSRKGFTYYRLCNTNLCN